MSTIGEKYFYVTKGITLICGGCNPKGELSYCDHVHGNGSLQEGSYQLFGISVFSISELRCDNCGNTSKLKIKRF